MRLLLLNKGFVTQVDDCDFEMLSQFYWHLKPSGNTSYAANAKLGKLHRFLLMAPKGFLVDHIDGDGLNNQRDNLRICTQTENIRNQVRRKNRTGFKGVYLQRSSATKPYQATLRVSGRTISLGYFCTAEEAARAYDEGAIRYFGGFANLNFAEARI